MANPESTLRQRKTTHSSNIESDRSNKDTIPTQKLSNGNGKAIRNHQRRCSYVHTEPPPVFYIITSKNADAVMAALGAGLCLSALTWASEFWQLPLMGSFLMNTSIKMFYNREPPTLSAFWKSSLFCIPAGTILHLFFENNVLNISKKYANPIVVAIVMLYWKLFGEIWTAANSLAIYITVGCGPWGRHVFPSHSDSIIDADKIPSYPYFYLLAPYLSGHLFLYIFALGWSKLRALVRAKLVTREFFMNESNFLQSLNYQQREERLRDLFDRMDLDQNGRLDVFELQLAFRSALECDITLEESKIIMKSTDTDGDSTLDFHEFRAAIDKLTRGH